MAADFVRAAPEAWRPLLAALHGVAKIGEPGIRDADSPCDVFDPGTPGGGDCDTDGHYMCSECRHISERETRRRADLCEDCGAPLQRGGVCAPCDESQTISRRAP